MQPILYHYLSHFLVLKIPLLQFSLGVCHVPDYDFSPSYPNFYCFPFLVWVVPFCFSTDSAIFQFLPLSCFIEHILSLQSVWRTPCLVSFPFHSFRNYLLKTDFVPGIVLGNGYTMMNQISYIVQFFLFNPEVPPLVHALTISCLTFFLECHN